MKFYQNIKHKKLFQRNLFEQNLNPNPNSIPTLNTVVVLKESQSWHSGTFKYSKVFVLVLESHPCPRPQNFARTLQTFVQ